MPTFTTTSPITAILAIPAGRIQLIAADRADTTVDGDITVGRLDGDAEIRTVRGDLQLTEAAHGSVVLRTETGAITVSAAAGVSASLEAGTTLGRIHNTLKNADATPGLTIHATTTLGDITASSR